MNLLDTCTHITIKCTCYILHVHSLHYMYMFSFYRIEPKEHLVVLHLVMLGKLQVNRTHYLQPHPLQRSLYHQNLKMTYLMICFQLHLLPQPKYLLDRSKKRICSVMMTSLGMNLRLNLLNQPNQPKIMTLMIYLEHQNLLLKIH